MRTNERVALRAASRELHHHPRPTPAVLLRETAAWCEANHIEWDVYGAGGLLGDLEVKVANLLGFPAARFLPSGTLAQPLALRIWADRAGTNHVGLHPSAHLEHHEQRGYSHLWGLRATLVGPSDRPLQASDLAAVPERLAALLTELPLREHGAQLPTWGELQALKDAAAARSLPLHLDGARLWECGPFYARPLHEITAGFSSCYVSFYKGIGALSGAMLLGSDDVVAEARVWQRRAGGTLYTALPNAATAAMWLDRRLAAIPDWVARAHQIADALRPIPGVRLLPDPPHTPLFHVHLDLELQAAFAARDRVARERGLWLFSVARAGAMPRTTVFEWYVGERAMAAPVDEIAAAFADLLGQ